MRVISGEFIVVYEFNKYFSDVTEFVFSHYDRPEYKDSAVVLGVYQFKSLAEIRSVLPRKKIIVFQLESLTSCNHLTPDNKAIIHNIRTADEVWEYDPANSQILTDAGIPNKLIPFRYTESLDVELDKSECNIDLLFYGFLNHRRVNILAPMQARFYNRRSFVFVYGITGEELDKYIARSKIILNMHAFDDQAQEQVRMLRPVCNGKMVISEHSKHNMYGDAIIEFDSIDSLVSSVDFYLQNDRYKSFGANAREVFKSK